MENHRVAQGSTGGKQPAAGLFDQEEFPKYPPKREVYLHYLASVAQP